MGKLRIKAVQCYYLEDHAFAKYTTNGIFWKKIKGCRWDGLRMRFEFVPEKVPFSGFDTFIAQFKTIEDIKEYEKDRKRAVIDSNRLIDETLKEEQEYRKSILKKIF